MIPKLLNCQNLRRKRRIFVIVWCICRGVDKLQFSKWHKWPKKPTQMMHKDKCGMFWIQFTHLPVRPQSVVISCSARRTDGPIISYRSAAIWALDGRFEFLFWRWPIWRPSSARLAGAVEVPQGLQLPLAIWGGGQAVHVSQTHLSYTFILVVRWSSLISVISKCRLMCGTKLKNSVRLPIFKTQFLFFDEKLEKLWLFLEKLN